RAEKMLGHLGLREVELSIGLVDDAAIHELNRSFRKKDKPTDVLAFPMLDALPTTPGRKAKRGEPRAPELREVTGLLGDVIISIETAERQARENNRPLGEELTMLLAHGLLHLLGFDHMTDAEERAMTEATRELEQAAATRTTATRPGERRPKSSPAARKTLKAKGAEGKAAAAAPRKSRAVKQTKSKRG
ncbi:MAG TPA: rRNA maturation RNase YbeY, partial [Polyangiaceae bacterium]|nr:rRNA maturation RNase YbeY [Polyangiaceae bacterium]